MVSDIFVLFDDISPVINIPRGILKCDFMINFEVFSFIFNLLDSLLIIEIKSRISA